LASFSLININLMKVTISGSYRKHFDRLIRAKKDFQSLGAEVLRPHSDEITNADEELVRLEGDPEDIRAVQEKQLKALKDCDFVYVVNPGGYLGPSATLEVGYAYRAGTPIITSETPFEPVVAALIKAVATPEEAINLLKE
jgi:hypothetical protein